MAHPMPSQEHAILVDLFRASPRLALDLLRALGVTLAQGLEPSVVESTFPLAIPDRHVDVVVACKSPAGIAALVALVEVQLEPDDEKRFSWPHYVAAARARFRCDACLLVVTVEEHVAAWAAAPITIGPGSVFRAMVIGPKAVPHIAAADALSLPPELVLLSALAHGKDDAALLGATVVSLVQLGPERAAAYFDLLRYNLGEALDRALEALMTTTEHKYLSDFARKYYGEGRAEGNAEGKAEGELHGKRAALITVLAARGLTPTANERARIDACDDPSRLDRWIALAVQGQKVADALAD